ncbi:MAG: DNA-binding protein [Desulfobacterales bacterium]|jgi:predicted DNA-binding protein with PD1-like motif
MTLLSQIGSQPVRRLVQLRAKPGAALLPAIEEAVVSEGIRAGVIVSGLGALKKAVFRNLKHFPRKFPVTPEDRLYLEIFQPMELVSLTGWVAPKNGGATEIHAHFSASLVDGDTVITLGGHLTRETICGIKVVVAILEVAPEEVNAAKDPETQTHDIFLGAT